MTLKKQRELEAINFTSLWFERVFGSKGFEKYVGGTGVGESQQKGKSSPSDRILPDAPSLSDVLLLLSPLPYRKVKQT